ncbi:MAG: zinc-dependent metalloprotease [Cyclobacteriaceae bacterium]|nr:zinc-dependent metalloprotease [Cyclobacteriaceae bacterium]
MRLGILGFWMCSVLAVNAQLVKDVPIQQIKKGTEATVCYHKAEDGNLIIPPPEAFLKLQRQGNAKTTATAFEVTYVNFSPEAQLAFQKAVDIWATLIESPRTIRILAVWQPLGSGVLGGASPGTYIRNFDGAHKLQTWYPVALAEKIADREFNASDDPDIFAQFNSSFANWYFGTDGVPQPGKTDLVSVVLHEIGHGLGITKAYDVNTTQGIIGSFFSPFHVPYDHFLETGAGLNLVQGFTPPSGPLRTELTSTNLFFRSPLLSTVNRAKVYAPATFAGGSSIAHLDESTYNGTPNALMTPFIGDAEVMHNPGPVVMRMLADMGWINVRVLHTSLANTENVNSPFVVTATLQSDTKDPDGSSYSFDAGEVKLNYTTNGTTFTTIAMSPTGQPNQFTASMPATGAAISYGYYISLKDNLGRTLTKPGVLSDDGSAPVQRYYVFEAGPDTSAPVINHTPKGFILATDTQLTVEATITDNLGVQNASLEYQVNTGSLQTVTLTLASGSTTTYAATISLPALAQGDVVKYRIRATDVAVAQNVGSAPSATTFFEVNVVSLGVTQNSYFNDFNSTSADFFGDNIFSITTPAGFTNGAIHTSHPYPAGTGTGFISNYVYQLRIPIRLKATEALLKYDEIVLVEPGETGSVFGSDDFWDYVIAEGSKDGGITWRTLLDGYDSRAQSAWLSKFNSSSDTNNPPNSTAVGDPSLYRTRTVNLLTTFAPNDEVVIRFRLNTDQLVVGWGWAIDNLKIQIDDTPPVVRHNHVDYVKASDPQFLLTLQATDASGVAEVLVEAKVNEGTLLTDEIPVQENQTEFTSLVSINNATAGDKLYYRIRVKDTAGNQTLLPADGFFQVAVITFGSPVQQYVTDFNSSTTDFVGNFYSLAQPAGFTNGAMHTAHPYSNGFGLPNGTSSYALTLTKPVTVNATNPWLAFSEIAIVEYAGLANKDFVVVEGSKDLGETWHALITPYSALAQTAWRVLHDVNGNGTAANYITRVINLTASGDFVAGDNLLIRFRLVADATGNAWGWAIDNLSIQGPVTGVMEVATQLSVFPNPVVANSFNLEINAPAQRAQLQIINQQGQSMIREPLTLLEPTTHKEYACSAWSNGVYFVRLSLEDGSTITKKVIKATDK